MIMIVFEICIFEFCVGGTMEIYDKEKEIGYAVHITPIEYDENGKAINL